MKAHRRQFVIGNRPESIKEDWQTIGIGENLYLSHCPDLTVLTAQDINGSQWYLLGLAIQTEQGRDDPLTEIENSPTVNVSQLYKKWNGRWILIGNDEIHLDCFGLLGCFYTDVNEERWISSSLAILREIRRFSPRPEKLKHKSDLEWYPPPLTRFEGVRKLLPSQVLNLKTFRAEQRAFPLPVCGLSYDEILEKLIGRMKGSLTNLVQLNRNIYLPLTAGYDSRLILAAAHYSGIKVRTYTAEKPDMSDADIKFPHKLAGKAGYDHLFIKMNPAGFSKEREELYDYHTGGDTDDIDRKRFSHGQWDVFGKEDLILRGGGWEIGRCIAWSKLRPGMNVEAIIAGSLSAHVPFKTKAFSEWIDWVNQTTEKGFDWRDRFYWEQRVGGWLSSIEQSLDLTETERFYIVNTHEITSLLLTPPVKWRKVSRTHIDLIRRMSPALLQFPFNHVPFPMRLRRLSKRAVNGLYRRIKRASA